MESEIFLLGHWKNFDELESSLSLDELTALLESSRKKTSEDRRFSAAIQGVELDGDESAKEPEDINELQNSALASQEGFGVNEGLGFMQMEG